LGTEKKKLRVWGKGIRGGDPVGGVTRNINNSEKGKGGGAKKYMAAALWTQGRASSQAAVGRHIGYNGGYIKQEVIFVIREGGRKLM